MTSVIRKRTGGCCRIGVVEVVVGDFELFDLWKL